MSKILPYNQHYFDQINTPAKAYFLGLSLADASINKYWYSKKNKFLYRYKLGLHPQDKEVIKRLGYEMDADAKIDRSRSLKRDRIYTTMKIEVKNKHLVETLGSNFGGYNKSNRIKYSVPKEFKNHFVRGYFDGDGSLNNSVSGWELSLTGYEPILKSIMSDVGIASTITNDRTVKRVRLRRKEYILKFLKYIYYDVNFEEEYPLFIKRKYERMQDFMLEASLM